MPNSDADINGNPTINVRSGEELDVKLIDSLLKANIEGLVGQPNIKQFPSGHSNLTYMIGYENRELVLRRPPKGTKPKSGHSMLREYSVMKALKPLYPSVPNVLHYDGHDSELGAEFYVMDRVDGDVLHKTIPENWGFDKADGRRLCTAFFDKLIELHNVDYKAAGLQDFGKPDGYVRRQIDGWNGRFERAKTPDIEDFSDVSKWLDENCPQESGQVSVLHGDYRLDNVILDKKDHFNILAVLDWEISALGDPLMDLGNTLAYWTEAGDPEEFKAMSMQPSMADGMMSRDEVVGFYCEKRNVKVPNISFYMAYGTFRLAVILQQIYYRFYHGQTKNAAFEQFAKQVNMLGNHARSIIDKA